MRTEIINKLMAMLPEGERKNMLRQKLEMLSAKSNNRGGEGLQDSFEFKTTGHIKIEAIDESGNVVGTLADQPNLVVDGAEEVLLRAFSGDPNRVLYKNRKVKNDTGETNKIYIPESKLNGEALFDGDQLLHAPNLLWGEVNDEDFEVSYGFYPVTVYVKEEVSTELGKKAFSVSNKPSADRVPMSSEIYSSYTNMFIGIGEGKNYPVALSDPRLKLSENVTVQENRAESSTTGANIEFKAKISNFKLEVESSSTGAKVDVYINSMLKDTIDTYNGDLLEPETLVFEYDDLNIEGETEVRIVHSGSDHDILDPIMAITGIHFDELTKDMNGLMKEFKNFEKEFVTPTTFNTTPMGPYTIQLPHFPVAEGVDSVQVMYEGTPFSEGEELTDTTYKVDRFRGVLEFNRALTGVSVSYKITGEVYDSELVSTMSSGSVAVENELEEIEYKESNDYTLEFSLNEDPGDTVLVDQNGEELTLAATPNDFADGTYFVDPSDRKVIQIAKNDKHGNPITHVEIRYMTKERPGIPTGYTRAIIEKPKTVNEYPWFELDKGAVRFVAEFPEMKPGHNVTIREMGLFDGPRVDDKIAGFRNYPVKAFSLVRVGETRKETNTGIRITWTITLLNEEGQPFKA